MFKNAQNSTILRFKNFQFCTHQHQQKIGHQCKRPHEPQDNSFAFSHKFIAVCYYFATNLIHFWTQNNNIQPVVAIGLVDKVLNCFFFFFISQMYKKTNNYKTLDFIMISINDTPNS